MQLESADRIRRMVAARTPAAHKSALGQFMTPAPTARFMADMFADNGNRECRLLDAGAGIGGLSCAFLDRWKAGGFNFHLVQATAVELDDALVGHLGQHLGGYADVSARIVTADYITWSTGYDEMQAGGFTHAILNPPYKKIGSRSAHRLALRGLGVETVNLYSAFVALAVMQAAPGGQIVAIVPRSFCNGPYYRPFRDFILQRTALRHIHVFGSRRQAFREDDVLQENVIIRLERGGRQGPIVVSSSTDDSFDDLLTQEHAFDRIVFPDDPEGFIHVPTSAGETAIEAIPAVRYSLADLGIQISTGPVVDFRLKDHLRAMPGAGAVPLIYPAHVGSAGTFWPLPDIKKPNAILRNSDTEKWLYPNGFYCAVRRFSAKEEKRRVMAGVIEPAAMADAQVIGIENHLNVFHQNKRGLPEELARGLAVFLNSAAVDEHFRRFNGHTQVNATDLRTMKYPSRDALLELGKWAMQRSAPPTVEQIEDRLNKLSA